MSNSTTIAAGPAGGTATDVELGLHLTMDFTPGYSPAKIVLGSAPGEGVMEPGVEEVRLVPGLGEYNLVSNTGMGPDVGAVDRANGARTTISFGLTDVFVGYKSLDMPLCRGSPHQQLVDRG